MTDIFFADPADVPLPPEEVRIRDLSATPWPNGRRVKVYLEVTPFQKRPSGEMLMTNQDGQPVASASIIETIDPKMEVNLHLRTTESSGVYQLSVVLFYLQEIDEEGDELIEPSERMIVDEMSITLEIP